MEIIYFALFLGTLAAKVGQFHRGGDGERLVVCSVAPTTVASTPLTNTTS